jgi:hypothetical protein
MLRLIKWGSASETQSKWMGRRATGFRSEAWPAREHRRDRIMLNLTNEEHKPLMKAAGETSAAAFARSVALRYLARPRLLSYSRRR